MTWRFDSDIAIVGLACVFPQAANVRQFWTNLVGGVDAVGEVPPDRWPGMERILNEGVADHGLSLPPRGAFLPGDLRIDAMRFGVLPHAVNHGDPDQFLMLNVVAEALADAGVTDGDPFRAKTDLIVGHGGYSSPKALETIYRAQGFQEVLQLIERRFPELMPSERLPEVRRYLQSCLPPNEAEALATVMPNIIACRAANRLNLGGAAYLVDGACSSSLLAVEHAVNRLRSGIADAAVAAGIFMTNYIPFWHIFSRLGALSPSGHIRPMDRRADGLVVGEGAGAAVLMRLDDAIHAGKPIYAIVKGVGSSSNGREVNVLAPGVDGQKLALERAYRDAQVHRDDIDYLELHGTGTVAGDTVELETVRQFFGPNSQRHHRCMGSVKSMIGHAMPASGMASLIKTALSLSNKVIPASLHCEEPRDEVAATDFFVNHNLRPWIRDPAAGPRRAGVNAFGFGGINVHLVLEEVPTPTGVDDRVPTPRPVRVPEQWPCELYVFSGVDRAALLDRARRLLDFLNEKTRSDWYAGDVAFTLWQDFDLDHPHRLALICTDLATLRRELTNALAQLEAGETKLRNSDFVFYSSSADRPLGKLAVLFPGNAFPGMVGKFPDHLRELAVYFPGVRAEIDFLSARDRDPDDPVPMQTILWPPHTATADERAQYELRLLAPQVDDSQEGAVTMPAHRHIGTLANSMSNWIRWVMLRDLEMPVDMITGLSLGEMTAVCAAGCVDYYSIVHPYMQATAEVVDDMLRLSEHRTMFLMMPPERFAKLTQDYPRIRLAFDVSNNAFCIAGPRGDLKQIGAELRQEGIFSQGLPFPPVHTEYFSRATELLESAFSGKQVAWQAPRVPVYSSILAETYPHDGEGIRTLLFRNFVEPLRVQQTLTKLFEDGARIVVQAGLGQIASMSTSNVLPPGVNIQAVGVDIEDVNPIEQFHRVCGLLLSWGVKICLDALYRHRDVQRLDFSKSDPTKAPTLALPLRMDWSPLNSPAAQAGLTPVPSPPSAGEKVRVRGLDEETTAAIPPQILDAARELPLIGRVVSYTPNGELVCERTFSLEEDRFLLDHLFICGQEIKPPEELWPVVPMTFSVEMMAEVAALWNLDWGLVGFEDVRMSRWIDVTETGPKTVRVTAAPLGEMDGVSRVRVTIDDGDIRVASGTVLFAEEYAERLPFADLTPPSDIAWPVTAHQTYSERRMFHGPQLQVIAQLDRFGDSSFTAALEVLSKDGLFASRRAPQLLTDPCLMDGISQICGLWLQCHESIVFPTGIERIEFYQPTPPVGTIAPAHVELTHYDADTKQFQFRGELLDGEGNLWLRFTGWADWLFPYTPRFCHWTLRPEVMLLAEQIELPDNDGDLTCVLLPRTEVRQAGLERAWRTALSSSEARELRAIANPDQQREFVISRIAAKDAVRLWWEREFDVREAHPACIEIKHDAWGKPLVANSLGLPNPHISLSHVRLGAVAVASGSPVGVDVEPVTDTADNILEHFTEEGERAWLESMVDADPDGGWPTRLWCAKEAAGKLWGDGLNGRPKDIVLVDCNEDDSLILRRNDGQSARVGTGVVDGLAMAWAQSSRIAIDQFVITEREYA